MDTVRYFIPESLTTQAILIGAAVGFVVYLITKKSYRYPPGPWGPPLIGNLLALRKKSLYHKLIEWEKDHGPIMTVHMGPMRMVFLNRLDVIKEAFVKKSVDFAGRPKIFSGDAKRHRKTFTGKGRRFYTRQTSVQYEQLGTHYMKGNKLEETTSEVMEMVLAEMKKEQEAFNIQHYIELIIFNIFSKICFDEKYYMKGNKFEENLNEVLDMVMAEMRKAKGAFNIQQYTELIVFNILSKICFDEIYAAGFTDAMLLAQTDAAAEENPELLAQITDTHVAQTVSDIFQAGVDTSQQTLYWTVLFVSAHPEIQDKIHEEVDSVLGARTTPRLSDRAKLPYTEAVLYESMRVATVTPLSLPRTTTCDTTIGDYEIPKGTMVTANLYAVHHDPKHWPDPNKFKPERFLDTSGKIMQRPEGWMPFSSGKRACMAESLAKPELHLLLAGLYRNFEIHLPAGVTADLNPLDVSGVGYLTKPYEVVIKNRFE